MDDLEADEYLELDTSPSAVDFGGLSLSEARDPETAVDSMSTAQSLLQQERDPLGIADAEYRKEAKQNPQLILLSSTMFDPKQFLSRVHHQTTLEELKAGREHLVREIESRDASIRELVRQNFSRFVFAKNNIDAVYADMKAKGVSDPANPTFGTKKTLDKVTEAYDKALKVFQPLVKRTEQEADMKRRLDFMAKYRQTVFSVARKLREAWQSGDYGSAVNDYRKGKLIVEESGDGNLKAFWKGQVEPEAERVRQVILAQLIGDQAGWYKSFDVYYRLITMYKVLDPSTDPMRLWTEDYGSRLVKEIDTSYHETINAIAELHRSWKDEYSGARLEGGLVRSLMTLIRTKKAIKEAIPRLDFLCCAVWSEKQVFFDGLAVILTRLLTILAESDLSSVQVEQLKVQFAKTVGEHLDGLLISDTSTSMLDSAIVTFNGAINAITSLSLPIHRHYSVDGPLLQLAQDTLLQSVKCLLKSAWSMAPVECKRVARFEDWSIDQKDYSTVVMRSLESLMLHYAQETNKIMHIVQKVIGHQLTPKDNLLIGLERSVHACLDAFLDEIKKIVIDHDITDHLVQDRFTLPQVAHSYKLLLSLANLHHFRNISINTMSAAYEDLLGHHVQQVITVL